MTRSTLAAGAAACLMLLSACGGGGDAKAAADPQDAKAAKALSASLLDSGGGTGLELTPKQADCIGNGMVDGVGVEELQKQGLLTKDLKVDRQTTNVEFSKADATTIVDTMFRCAPVMDTIKKGLAQSSQLGAEAQKCVDDALDEKVVKHGVRGRLLRRPAGVQP